MAKRGKLVKQLICLIIAAACVFAFAGCGSYVDQEPVATSAPATPAKTPDEPSDDLSAYKGLVFSKVYGNSAKKDAATSAGFIELYNSSDKEIDCSALAVYYKTPLLTQYKRFNFSDVKIPAGGYYLIKCAYSPDYQTDSEIISIDHFDAFWNLEINGGDVSLILAEKAYTPAPEIHPEECDKAISYFRATDDYTFDTGCIKSLSKYKYAVRVALIQDSGWEAVDLLDSTTTKLSVIVPKYSGGSAGSVKHCAINEVGFDHAPGFYENEFYLTLSAPEGAKIYYTEEGLDPRTSNTRDLYRSAILLKDTTEMKAGRLLKKVSSTMGGGYGMPSGVRRLPGCHVIRACYELEDGYVSGVFTATYFVSSMFKDFNVTVMSISMETDEFVGEHGFYNNYYGSENIQNPRGSGVMEVFGRDGSRQGCSNIELSVSGHGSSGAPMKSMKVFYKKADNESTGTEDKLYYDLFDGYSVNEKGQRITDFARLLLRNSGNDYGMTYIRDAYMQRVSRVLNIDTMAYAPALVFINGGFWGVYNVRERYSGDYVESHHGIDKDNVALIESDYSQVHTNVNAPFVLTSGLDYDPDAFNTLMEYIRSRDLSVQKYFDYVADRIDIDSFIDMYVARMYFNAVDWPENNIKIWRNRAGDGDPSGYDTKWHFTLLDMDFGVGFYDNLTAYDLHIWGTMHGTHCVIGTIMHKLLQNEAFKKKFVYRFYEVSEMIFTPEFLESELDIIVNERAPFVYLQTQRWGASQESYSYGVGVMREFVRKRQSYVTGSFLSEMGFSKAEFRAYYNKEATLSFKYSQISNVYMNGNPVSNTDSITVGDGIEVELEFVPRSNYQITSITYEDFTGNVLKTIDGSEIVDNKIKLTIDEPVRISINASKKK